VNNSVLVVMARKIHAVVANQADKEMDRRLVAGSSSSYLDSHDMKEGVEVDSCLSKNQAEDEVALVENSDAAYIPAPLCIEVVLPQQNSSRTLGE